MNVKVWLFKVFTPSIIKLEWNQMKGYLNYNIKKYSYLLSITQKKKKHSNKTRHAGHCWSDILLRTPTHEHACVGWPAKTYISSVWTQDEA